MSNIFNDAQLLAFCKDFYAYKHICLILCDCFDEATNNHMFDDIFSVLSRICQEQLMLRAFTKSFW